MKRIIIKILPILAAVFFLAYDSYGQSWNPGVLEDSINSFLDPLTESQSFMGTVLIGKGDSVLFVRSYGYANLEHLVPNTPETVYRIGSMTKQFTATAIMILVQENKLSVDSKLSEFIQDYPEGDKLTVHQLLTHTSGIPNYTALPDYPEFSRLPATLPGLISRIKKLPLEFEPGTKFKYCDSGYMILSYIIEQVSGLSYPEFLEKKIFQPLGMDNTGYDINRKIIKNRASGYSKEHNRLYNAAYIDMTVPSGAGGLHSTVHDLYLWDRSLYTDKILSMESRKKMFTFYIADYGYGWGREIRKNGRISIGHNGMINGFSSIIHRFVDDDVVIIILANTDNFSVNRVFDQVPAIFFRENE